MHYGRVTAAALIAASASVSIPSTPPLPALRTTIPSKHFEGPAATGMHRPIQSEAALAADFRPWLLAFPSAPHGQYGPET